MKEIKLYKVIIMFLILSLVIAPITVSAHPASQIGVLDSSGGTTIGSEDIGWIADEFLHLGSTYLTYQIELPDDLVYSVVNEAISIWSSYATITQSSSPTLTFNTYYDDEDDYHVAAKTHEFVISSGDHPHLVSCTISFNYYNGWSGIVAAHEIGHVFGLNDLYDSSNHGRLMFGYTSNQGYPTAQDIKGFNVITGIHTNHNWLYSNSYRQCVSCDGIKTEAHAHIYTWSDYDTSTHKGVCRLCGQTVYENHSYYWNSSTGCTRCGRTGLIIMSPPNITEDE